MLDPSIPLNPGRPQQRPMLNTLLGLQEYQNRDQDYAVRQRELQAYDEQKAAARQADAQFSAMLQSGEAFKNPEAVFAVAGPERAKTFYDGLSALQRLQAGDTKDREQSMLRVLRTIEVLPADQQPKAWDFARQGLVQAGVIQDRPELAQFDPNNLKVLIAQLGGEPKAPPALIQRDPTRDLVNPQTGAVVQPGTPAPVKPPTPPAVGSFEDYVVRKFGPTPTPAQIAQARREYGDAGRVEVKVGGAGEASPEPVAPDPASADILSQTGLSMNAFMALTGRLSSLPRDAATRNRASTEAQAFARKRGVDVSTLASQYKAQNAVLERNIERLNNTQIMEAELKGTVENLQGVIGNDLSKVRVANVWKVWAGEQVNDPKAEQYAFHLGQLRNELAAYYAAAAGRPGSGITVSDLQEAEKTIKNGISQGGLAGLMKGVEDSTSKMGPIMQGSVDRAQKAVWTLFGVGQNYQPKGAKADTVKDPMGIR